MSNTSTPKTPEPLPLSLTFIDDSDSGVPWDTNFCDGYTPYLSADDDDTPIQMEKIPDYDRKALENMSHEVKSRLELLGGCVSELAIIKQQKLYRETHSTFAAYCKDTFGLDDIKTRNIVIEFMKNKAAKLLNQQDEE